MGFGTDVRMTLDEIDSFFLIHPYSGSATVETRTDRFGLSRSGACVLNPTDSVRLTWHADCSAIMVRIDPTYLAQRIGLLLDRPIRERLRFDHAVAMNGPPGDLVALRSPFHR